MTLPPDDLRDDYNDNLDSAIDDDSDAPRSYYDDDESRDAIAKRAMPDADPEIESDDQDDTDIGMDDDTDLPVGGANDVQGYAYGAPVTRSEPTSESQSYTTDLELPDSDAAEPPVADDLGAASDLRRANNRADLFQSERRSQFSTFLLAIMIILIGAALLIDAFTPENDLITPPVLLGAAIIAISIGLLGRYLVNGRREVGLLFFGLALGFAVLFAAAFSTGIFDPAALFPLIVIAFGITLILLIFFGARERGLLLPGLIVCLIGVVLLPWALGSLPNGLLDFARTYAPALLIILGILLVPVALRRRA